MAQIRCSRYTPACTRCVKRRLSCFYPEPPNRRRFTSLLATSASSPSRQSHLHETARDEQVLADEDLAMASSFARKDPVFPAAQVAALPLGSQSEVVLGHQSAYTNANCATTISSSLTGPRRLKSKLPELEIGLLLIEVYFSRVWTAALLFDHRSFVEDYRAANVPEHVLLCVFALASL